MTASRKARITHAFDRAADYESHAHVQRRVAKRLANQIAELDLDTTAPALEIGCGTGFLTSSLLDRRPDVLLTVSDLAPAMIARARRLVGERANVTYALIDGETIDATDHYGLIASSLAFQWFEEPTTAIDRIIAALKPGGWLAFSTLVAGSFREWRDAQKGAGLPGLTRRFPDISALIGSNPDIIEAATCHYSLTEQHPDGRSFLRSLKAIGAGTRWSGPAPSHAALREAIRLFEREGASITYEIAEVTIRRKK
jgi:malonyl-CoA O-methyltransferase